MSNEKQYKIRYDDDVAFDDMMWRMWRNTLFIKLVIIK